MYDYFLKAVGWLGTSIKIEVLTLAALCVIGAIILYQFIITIIFAIIKRRGCSCRRYLLRKSLRCIPCLLTAWIFAIFALMILTSGVSFGVLMLKDIMLPVAILVSTYIILAFFGLFNKGRGSCCCTNKTEVKPKQKETKETTGDKNKKVIHDAFKSDRSLKTVNKEKRAIANSSVPRYTEKSVIPFVAKNESEKARNSSRKNVVQKTAVSESVAEVQALDSVGTRKKSERTESDLVVTADASSIVARTDDFQRRMEAVRKAMSIRDEQVVEKTVRQEQSVYSEQKSTTEVKRESEQKSVTAEFQQQQQEVEQKKTSDINQEKSNMKTQFELLRQKLEQDQRAIKMPLRNKYDEREVRAALMSLKNAMGDLQGQTDAPQAQE